MDRVIKLEVVGYQIRRGEETFGAAGSGNAVRLRISFDAAWDGMVKTALFTDARGAGGTTTEVELLTQNADGSFDALVPPEAMAYVGKAEMTLEGAKIENGSVTETLTTRPLTFRVYDSGAWRVAWNTEPISATDKQQIMAKVNVAEAYAKGTVDGVPVSEGTGFEDNAKFYKEHAQSAKNDAVSAKNDAVAAKDDAVAAKNDAVSAKNDAEAAEGNAFSYAENAASSADDARDAKNEAVIACGSAQAAAETGEAYAAGTCGGQPILDPDDPRYHNNAKYYAAQAEAYAKGTAGGDDVPSGETGYHDNAKYYAEQSASNQYAAFPTETQTDAVMISTDVGADAVPVKSIEVRVTAVGEGTNEITLRRCGKNLLPRGNALGSVLVYAGGQTAFRYGYRLQHLPAGNYTVCFTHKSGTNNEYFGYEILRNGSYSSMKTIIDGAANTPRTISLQSGDVLYIYCPDGSRSLTAVQNWIDYNLDPQLEAGNTATAFEEHVSTDYPVSVSGAGTYTPGGVATRKGKNHFFVVPQEGVSATVCATYRLDPTLVYEKLQAAIVVAGN